MPLTTPIFVSYRRDDSGPDAQFIAAHLRKRFGDAEVFCDVTAIAPGQRWPKRLRQEIERASTVVAVIGPVWLTAADQWGRRRLDDAADWVRCELKKALEAGKAVVPVTVRGAKMPDPKGLPPALRSLAECQGIEVRRDYQEHDLELLVKQFVAAGRPALPVAHAVATPSDFPISAAELFSHRRVIWKHLMDRRRELEDRPRLLAVRGFLRDEQKAASEGKPCPDPPLESGDERRKLPAFLEPLAIDLLMDQLVQEDAFDVFAEEILLCHHSAELWDEPEPYSDRWWSAFKRLAIETKKRVGHRYPAIRELKEQAAN